MKKLKLIIEKLKLIIFLYFVIKYKNKYHPQTSGEASYLTEGTIDLVKESIILINHKSSQVY